VTVRRKAGLNLLLAPAALADTCCTNTEVLFEPSTAQPGVDAPPVQVTTTLPLFLGLGVSLFMLRFPSKTSRRP
jgi:hypothetical protein